MRPFPACRKRVPAKVAASVAKHLYAVELTANFLACLDGIGDFLLAADVAHAYDDLLAQLRTEVVPNLSRFPNLGHRYLDNPPRSVEALALLSALPPGTAESLRIYLAGDYLILYVADEARRAAILLSIRHHRQLSFDFAGIWNNEV